MSDETTPQDSAAMSPASAGSVAGEPVAWAVLDSRGTVCVAYTCREAAEAYCEGTFNRLAPLYRSPTLTDAEREAVARAAQWMVQLAKDRGEIHSAGYLCDDAATLRGLLERLK